MIRFRLGTEKGPSSGSTSCKTYVKRPEIYHDLVQACLIFPEVSTKTVTSLPCYRATPLPVLPVLPCYPSCYLCYPITCVTPD